MKVQSFRFRKVLQKIIDLFVVNLQKRAVNIVALALAILVVLYLLEKTVDSSGDESCVVLIWDEVFEKSVLMLLRFELLWYWALPIASEHGVSFSWTSLSVCEYCQIISFRYFWEIVPEEIENIALSLFLSYRFIEFSFNHRNRVGRYLDCFSLNGSKSTSYSTSATSLVPSSLPTRGLTRT